MIEKLGGLPENIVGFDLHGELTVEDYRNVLIPGFEWAARTGEIRCVLVIHEFQGMAPAAVHEDLKLGVEHLRAWKRVALVTDIEWMTHLTALFGWMSPGQTRTFPIAQQAAAVAWAAD